MCNSHFTALSPEWSQFAPVYDAGKTQLVWRKCVSDLDTPVSAYLKLTQASKNSFLLESVEGGNNLGRYSIIGMMPDLIWKAHGNRATLNRAPHDPTAPYEELDMPVLDSLRHLLAISHIDLPTHIKRQLPPMAAGVFGYFGYDTARLIEHLPNKPRDVLGMPDAILIRPTLLAVFDNVRHEITFIAPIRPTQTISARDAYNLASEKIKNAVATLEKNTPKMSAQNDASVGPVTSNTPPQEYCAMVEKAKRYIKAGDIFQVVLSQRFSMDFAAPPFHLYRALRRLNPSPFLFFLHFDEGTLVGSSPEILVRVRDKKITIRPIAGTRPRGASEREDAALEADLLADEKERAEHLMLLDLGRNDVGRSAKIGSVHVTDQFMIERYSHVMHIVSNVTGELSQDTDAVCALLAGFPAGTVSGAPKIRAMEIIDELEKDARGPYGGCIGYFSADGNIDTCIALRTALIKDGKMHIQAGAGIVADSIPTNEQEECANKANALITSAKIALSGIENN